MVKSLEEIQQENRRFILEANYGTAKEALNNKSLPLEVRGGYSCLLLTLSRVLIALNLDEECWLMLKHLRIPKENGATIFWNLTKETLEEQSKETQRAINELLTKK
jgi:hypothetical protein